MARNRLESGFWFTTRLMLIASLVLVACTPDTQPAGCDDLAIVALAAHAQLAQDAGEYAPHPQLAIEPIYNRPLGNCRPVSLIYINDADGDPYAVLNYPRDLGASPIPFQNPVDLGMNTTNPEDYPAPISELEQSFGNDLVGESQLISAHTQSGTIVKVELTPLQKMQEESVKNKSSQVVLPLDGAGNAILNEEYGVTIPVTDLASRTSTNIFVNASPQEQREMDTVTLTKHMNDITLPQDPENILAPILSTVTYTPTTYPTSTSYPTMTHTPTPHIPDYLEQATGLVNLSGVESRPALAPTLINAVINTDTLTPIILHDGPNTTAFLSAVHNPTTTQDILDPLLGNIISDTSDFFAKLLRPPGFVVQASELALDPSQSTFAMPITSIAYSSETMILVSEEVNRKPVIVIARTKQLESLDLIARGADGSENTTITNQLESALNLMANRGTMTNINEMQDPHGPAIVPSDLAASLNDIFPTLSESKQAELLRAVAQTRGEYVYVSVYNDEGVPVTLRVPIGATSRSPLRLAPGSLGMDAELTLPLSDLLPLIPPDEREPWIGEAQRALGVPYISDIVVIVPLTNLAGQPGQIPASVTIVPTPSLTAQP